MGYSLFAKTSSVNVFILILQTMGEFFFEFNKQGIHGGSNENNSPTLDGMWCTLVNEATPDKLKGYFVNSNKTTKKVIGSVVKTYVTTFEASQENLQLSCVLFFTC